VTIHQWLIPLAPEFVLLFGACLALLVGVGRRTTAASPVALLTVVAALVLSVYVKPVYDREVLPGLWLTMLTDYTRWITLCVGLLIILVNWRQPAREEHGEYMSMILFSLLGILLTASANDWVVLFLALELVSVPTYVLVALSRTDARASEAAVKYFFLGALSAALLAYGVSFLYGASGTTAIHTIVRGAARTTFDSTARGQVSATIGMLLVFAGLFFKVAAVPFHAYAADVYEGAASPVTGLLGFVPKLGGFLALVKVLTVFDWAPGPSVIWLLWIIAAATMTAGNVLGLVQRNVKRALAYSSIAHTGYMLVALLVGPVLGQGPLRDGAAALLFYIAMYGVMNLGAFAALAAFHTRDRELETFEDLGGFARRAPATAFAFAVCVFSLMGLPPTAGFIAKLYVFSSAFSLPSAHPMHDAMIWLVIIAVVNTALGAAYYLRIIAAAFVGHEAEVVQPSGGAALRIGLALCTLPMLVFFVLPSGLNRQAQRATSVLQRLIRAPQVRVTTSDDPTSTRLSNSAPRHDSNANP